MSSDTFVITRLEQPTPNWQVWRVRNTGAGGVNDYVTTRSFVLSALMDAAREAKLDVFPASAEPWEEAWHRSNVDKYIDIVWFWAEVNRQEEWPEDVEMARRPGETRRQHEDRLCERLHYVILSIEAKDPKYLQAFPEVFGTVGWDVWWNDPTREPMAALRAKTTEELGPALKARIAEDLAYLQSIGKA